MARSARLSRVSRSARPMPARECERRSCFRLFCLWCFRFGLRFGHGFGLAIDHLAHQRGFCAQIAVYRRSPFELREIAAAPIHDFYFELELISGNDWPPEPRVIHGNKVEELALALRNLQQQEQTARLRHRLDDQYTRHNRLAREVPLKKLLVDRHVLHADNALQALHLQNSIDHQKRIAMRQQFLNFVHVQNHPALPVAPHLAHSYSVTPLCTRQSYYYMRSDGLAALLLLGCRGN